MDVSRLRHASAYAGTGRQRVTATIADHTEASAQVRVSADEVVVADLGLRSGRLDPVPRTLTVEVKNGQVVQRNLTLANTGDARLRYDVEEVPGRPVTSAGAGDDWQRITPYPSPA